MNGRVPPDPEDTTPEAPASGPRPADDAAGEPARRTFDPSVPPSRQAAADSARWTGVAVAGSQAGNVIFAFVLARLLGPDAYGVIAAATIYISFTVLFIGQGLGQALIQRRTVDQRDVATVSTTNLAVAVLLSALTVAVAPVVARAFDSPELAPVLRVLAGTLLVKALTVVPMALLNRRLLFRRIAAAQLGGAITGGVAGVIAALAGADHWALVLQVVVNDVFILALLITAVGPPSFGFAFDRLREFWRFSLYLLGSTTLQHFGRNIDNVLVGLFLGPRALAFYAVAYRFLSFVQQAFGAALNTVALPFFSRMQDDDVRTRRWLLDAAGVLSLVAFPFLAVLLVGAPEIVPLLLGPRWIDAAAPVQLLMVAGLARVVGMVFGPLCTARGRPDLVLLWAVIAFVSLAVGCVIGLNWGIVGVAAAQGVVAVALMPLNISHVGRLADVRFRDFAATLVPALAGSSVLAVTWIATTGVVRGLGAPDIVMVGTAGAAGIVAYAIVVRWGWPRSFASAASFVGLVIGRPGAKAAAATTGWTKRTPPPGRT